MSFSRHLMNRVKATILFAGVLGMFVLTLGKPDPATQARVVEVYGELPLSFEANQGQTDPLVKFLSRGRGYTLFLTPTEVLLTLSKRHKDSSAFGERAKVGGLDPESSEQQTQNQQRDQVVLHMQLIGASSKPGLTGLEELPGKSNYFIGNDPQNWHTNVPTYARVKYEDIYPGIDLIYYGNQGRLEYDFVVAPGANPETIKLAFQGADKIEIDALGELVLYTAAGQVRMQKPWIYQEATGVREEISGGYVLESKHQIGFQVSEYDATRTLVIDPVLVYSTFLGGSNFERGFGITVDASGNAYVTGVTASLDFPTENPFQPSHGGGGGGSPGDVFVAKFNADGSALVYSTYLGGSLGENILRGGITVDASGNAYVTGGTRSADFPTTVGAFQTVKAPGGSDAFVTKLNSEGSALVYSTYLGGPLGDRGLSIALDTSNNAYVTGETFSPNFPTVNPLQPTYAGGGDAFVSKLNASGSALVYSTYLGGSLHIERGLGIAVDADSNAHVTGQTFSADFPTTVDAYQTDYAGSADAFVTKLDSSGMGFVYSTYLGGMAEDAGTDIALDASGYAYVTGFTKSSDFPTENPFQSSHAGSAAFVTKLNPLGSALSYSTFLGGTGLNVGTGIAVDASGNAYVTGFTGAFDFPTENPIQPSNHGGTDAFLTKFNSTGSALIYSTYLGGSQREHEIFFHESIGGGEIALDASGNAYVIGYTESADFPTVNPLQPDFSGSGDAFVAKIGVLPCPWDLNGDGNVFVPDLLLLLGDFGTCDGTPADFDGDGCVGVPDLLALIANFGPCPGSECVWDLNGDGFVDNDDLQQVRDNFGPCEDCPEDVNGDGIVNGQDAAAVATHFGACP